MYLTDGHLRYLLTHLAHSFCDFWMVSLSRLEQKLTVQWEWLTKYITICEQEEWHLYNFKREKYFYAWKVCVWHSIKLRGAAPNKEKIVWQRKCITKSLVKNLNFPHFAILKKIFPCLWLIDDNSKRYVLWLISKQWVNWSAFPLLITHYWGLLPNGRLISD